ncbi:hypothetical protein VUR80DRAFT_384 [Thermomyces stellatus]
MSSPDPANAVKEHLLQDDTSSDQKRQPTAGDHEVQQYGDPATLKPPKLERYWLRTLVLILVPSAVTAWYGVIWVALVLGIENDDAVNYRTFSGSLTFYSWFIIGVFGLSWSNYGLAGVEVAMLQTRFWRAKNLVAFLMHSNNTWSSPSGWLKAMYHRQFPRLWTLLAVLSILPFIAFPLSGLVFEISDGYIATSDQPVVAGRNQTTFNKVYPGDLGGPGVNAQYAWRIGATPTIPGFGVVYTPPGYDRSQHSCLQKVPNTLPLTEAIPDMFLAPQADVPVSGKAWGLRVKYDCSNVRSASEFTILSQRSESAVTIYDNTTDVLLSARLTTPSGDFINVFNTGATPRIGTNVWAHSEIGSNDVPTGKPKQYDGSHPDFVPDDASKSSVFEYALWQIQLEGYYEADYPGEISFNRTLDPVIEGMGSPFSMSDGNVVFNDTFFQIRGGSETIIGTDRSGDDVEVEGDLTDLDEIFHVKELLRYRIRLVEDKVPILAVASPIGVRCVVSSGLGTASLDGVTSTFSDFERVDPEINSTIGEGPLIFGHTAFNSLNTAYENFYDVAHLPPKVSMGSTYSWQGYVHSQALLEGVMLAYGMDALQLMYNINPGTENSFVNTDLTSSREGKVLTIASLIPGVGTGYFVLALFCLWAGISVALGIIYGFRKRPSDKLGAYETLGRGVDLSGALQQNHEFKSGQTFYANKTFKRLPGT